MYKLIEHTADMGIEAWAGSAVMALLEMAQGLKSLMFGESPASSRLATEIVLHAEDPAELLVCWLNEIVYWSEKDNLVPAAFRVELFEFCRSFQPILHQRLQDALERVKKIVLPAV